VLRGADSGTESSNRTLPAEASAPHDLLVCVLKRHVVPSTYAELACRATVSLSANRQVKAMPIQSAASVMPRASGTAA
jgi:hypothetical protein